MPPPQIPPFTYPLQRGFKLHGHQQACRDPGSNRGPSDLRSDALPAELSRLMFRKVCLQHAVTILCPSSRKAAHHRWPGAARRDPCVQHSHWSAVTSPQSSEPEGPHSPTVAPICILMRAFTTVPAAADKESFPLPGGKMGSVPGPWEQLLLPSLYQGLLQEDLSLSVPSSKLRLFGPNGNADTRD